MLLLAAACGGNDNDSNSRGDAATEGASVAWPADGFLNYLPDNAALIARLPTLDAVQAEPKPFVELMRRLGWSADATATLFGTAEPNGLDRKRAAGFARTTNGWAHYLPAMDKGALNAALAARRAKLAHREEPNWIILSQGGAGAGHNQDDPLPPGMMALRVHYHPLLTAFANPGDIAEAGIKVGPGGLEFKGRLRPGPKSSTGAAFAATPALPDEALDLLPPNLAVRVETTLPAADLGSMLAERLAVHGGIKDPGDRVLVERFFREVFSGANSAAGLAFGIEFRDGSGTFVATGKIAQGRDSPILKRIRTAERTTFGPLVLDREDDVPQKASKAAGPNPQADQWHWRAWLAESAGNLEGLPESFWESIGLLIRGEDDGLDITYARIDDRFVFGFGPNARSLVRAVKKRLGRPFRRSAAGTHLRALHNSVRGAYKLGITLHGVGLIGMHENDRTALRHLFFGGEDAFIPIRTAIALVQREDGTLTLFGRVMY